MITQTKTVTLNPGESQQVNFFFTPSEAKVYGVNVAGLTGTFTVLAIPAQFEVSNLVINPSEVYAGELVQISIIVANVGGEAGTKTINLEVI